MNKGYKYVLPVLASILVFQAGIISCEKDNIPDLDFRQEMRDFVMGISAYAKNHSPEFIIIPQNGIELITNGGEADNLLNSPYLDAIDGNGQEDLFYGYEEDDQVTPENENAYLRAFLDRSKSAGKVILVTDYCSTESKMSDSYTRNMEAGYISFAADSRELDNIPDYPVILNNENNQLITGINQVENFLYLINNQGYKSKEEFINAIIATNYDLLIMDLFFEEYSFNADEITLLKGKENGGKRLVVCYLSIGEAEDYRYYWQSEWKEGNPSWLYEENPDWEGNFIVKYWEKAWQDIIYGNDGSYLKKILDAGFDGVYLDIIDAYEFYE